MTREDHINNLQSMIDDAEDMGLYDEDVESLKYAIKMLEQEPFINKPCVSEGICREDKMAMLDKIRTKIEELPKTYPFVNHLDTYVKEDDVLQIIDKYKMESEEQI